jgi:hypothetical protein
LIVKTATKNGQKKAGATKKTHGPVEHQRVSADALPRRSLEQALEVAKTLRKVYAGKSVSFEELANTKHEGIENFILHSLRRYRRFASNFPVRQSQRFSKETLKVR